MKNGIHTLTYNLYQDPQYTQVWGTAGNQLMTISVGGDLLNQPYTIYGRIDPTAANLGAPSGNYSDANIVLTISY
jgi:spore coat protein U-like protein